MKVGLTYDLRSDYLKEGYTPEETAEFDKEETIDGLENALKANGFETYLIGNAKRLMHELLAGNKWDIVFNICEGMYGDGRESLVPALLDAFRIPYVFSGAVTLGISLNKAFTKRIIRDAGINTADFFVVNKPADVDDCPLLYPLFAKPVAEGTGKGIENKSRINNKKELTEVCNNLLATFDQPVLVEEYLPGREFTVGIVGNGKEARAVGAMEVVYKPGTVDIYSYFNKENYKDLIEYQPVTGKLMDDCAEISLASWKALGASDGGRVDIRMDKNGKLSFIEINPLAGLNPVHSDLPILSSFYGITYNQLIGEIMKAAVKRVFGK